MLVDQRIKLDPESGTRIMLLLRSLPLHESWRAFSQITGRADIFSRSCLRCSQRAVFLHSFFPVFYLAVKMKLGWKYNFLAVALFLEAACSVLAHNEKFPLVLNLQREKVSATRAVHKYRRRDDTPPPTSVTLYDDVSRRYTQGL